ncbi:MAG: metallophosphoesterase [Oscillospiraceae bacterium]|nr:metallophosphoesterase [Oscillospiraceae bacterium]
MIYVTSDLHGYPLNLFLDLLNDAGFSENDFLFVLGDVIDRGAQGAELLRWMAEQPNVQLILGNHEAMLLSCDFLFETVTDERLSKLDIEKMNLLNVWLSNGATPTLSGLRKFLKEEPDVMEGILDYLRDAPLYDTVTIGGKNFILVHAGLENFHPSRPLNYYTPDELLWARPTMDTQYFDDAVVVFGHTPTEFFGEQYRGKVIKTKSWICIDTGAATGNKPMLLRLEDLKEFY